MGDARKDALRVEFDRRIKLEVHGAAVMSDSRRAKNKQHELIGWLRQLVYGRLVSYEDTNDSAPRFYSRK